jgi:hypothetical protein
MKPNYIGNISGQGINYIIPLREWQWRLASYLQVRIGHNIYRIKLNEVAKLIKQTDFKINKKIKHYYLEIDSDEG